MTNRFKGIDLNSRLEKIIPHMAVAEKYGGELQDLQAVWDNLSLHGQLSGGGADMSDTRQAFGELPSSLLNQLGAEALKKCIQEIGFKAQVAINVLVRNLFERTADIGFLSSDEDIRAVISLIFTRLCDADVEAHNANEVFRSPSIRSDRMQAGAKEDLATVLLGRRWVTVRASEVVEAIDNVGISPLPFMPPNMAGCAMYQGSREFTAETGR